MKHEDCPVKVGDQVYYEVRTMTRGYRVQGPYTVQKIKLRPRVVVLSGGVQPVEAAWHGVTPWTDAVAARKRRERACDKLAGLCYEWQTRTVRDDVQVENIEDAYKILLRLVSSQQTTSK